MKVFALVGAVVLASTARADTFNMNVFNFDYSANLPGEPITDAVINVGDTVHWFFIDGGHSVTSVMGIPEVFDSGVFDDDGATFEHTFTNVGTWWYYCIPHALDLGDGTAIGMVGTVTVLPSPGSAAVLACGALLGVRRRR